MIIAVILPSRGLMFSQTAEELLDNLEGYKYDIFFSHGLPIADCFEKPLKEVLRSPQYTHIWFVEDDMILEKDTLTNMVMADAPVVTYDYPVSEDGQGAVFADKAGKIVFTGTGCLLIKREVFNKLSKPYFRTDIKWGVSNYGTFIRLRANLQPSTENYGLHDVNFGIKLWQAEIPISKVGTTGQRKLVELGKSGSNNGYHKIEEWRKVRRNVLLKRYKSMPVQPIGKLISVITDAGEITVHPTHARKLIKAGIATKPKQQSVSIDYNDLII